MPYEPKPIFTTYDGVYTDSSFDGAYTEYPLDGCLTYFGLENYLLVNGILEPLGLDETGFGPYTEIGVFGAITEIGTYGAVCLALKEAIPSLYLISGGGFDIGCFDFLNFDALQLAELYYEQFTPNSGSKEPIPSEMD